MGYFSWNCTKCGHSIMVPHAVEKDDAWLNSAVLIFPNGNVIHGSYDGYGRIGGIELDENHTFEMMHTRCWERAGKPARFNVQSPSAGGQGYFYDDGDPEECDVWEEGYEKEKETEKAGV